jgi:hypothetical protein
LNTKEKLKDIETINKDYYKNIEILYNKKIEKSNEMMNYYRKREESYSKIEVFISELLKKKLIYMFRINTKKIPSLSIINKVAKENNIPSIPIKINLIVSEDISKDLSLFLEKIIPSITIDTDCVDIYETIQLDIPESFYNIIGYVGELLLRRFYMIQINNFNYFNWINNTNVFIRYNSLLNI